MQFMVLAPGLWWVADSRVITVHDNYRKKSCSVVRVRKIAIITFVADSCVHTHNWCGQFGAVRCNNINNNNFI